MRPRNRFRSPSEGACAPPFHMIVLDVERTAGPFILCSAELLRDYG